MAYEYKHLGSQIDYLKKREWEFAYQDRHPEIKAIADAMRRKIGRKGLKQLSAEFGCIRSFEVDKFLKGAKLEPHQIEAIKTWLNADEVHPTCQYCGATIIPLMVNCLNPLCFKKFLMASSKIRCRRHASRPQMSKAIRINPSYTTVYQELNYRFVTKDKGLWIYKFESQPYLTLKQEFIEVEEVILPYYRQLLKEIKGTQWIAMHSKSYRGRSKDIIFLSEDREEALKALDRIAQNNC